MLARQDAFVPCMLGTHQEDARVGLPSSNSRRPCCLLRPALYRSSVSMSFEHGSRHPPSRARYKQLPPLQQYSTSSNNPIKTSTPYANPGGVSSSSNRGKRKHAFFQPLSLLFENDDGHPNEQRRTPNHFWYSQSPPQRSQPLLASSSQLQHQMFLVFHEYNGDTSQPRRRSSLP